MNGDDDGRNGSPLYLDAERFWTKAGPMDSFPVACAMDIIFHLWWPSKQPVTPDAVTIIGTLSKKLPNRGYTVEKFEKHRADMLQFFTELPDGRWVPSPEYFSLIDGNPGGQS